VDSWLDTLLAACASGFPAGSHVHNAFDAVWHAAGHPFTPRAAATKGAMTVVHPWVFSSNCAERYGPLATETVHLPEYAVELAKGHAMTADRQVWVQEIGAPAPHIPAAQAPEFAAAALASLGSCTGVWGVTWWCSHDVNRELLDFPELEYTLGLLTSDRRRKPLARIYASFAASTAEPAPARPAALVLDDDQDLRPAAAPGGAFFEAWMDAARRGERLAIVSATQAADPALLAARGITELRPGIKAL
jgi:hypothetical protein